MSVVLKSKIVIVTVCRNSGHDLEQTYESLKNVLSSDCKWLVVDGDSSDGSTQFLDGLEPTSLIEYISEKDNGIYDAMNKALKVCSDDSYIWFLNAGDLLLISPSELSLRSDVNFYPVICGVKDTLVLVDIQVPFSVQTMSPKSKYPHQGMIVRNKILQKYGFDLDAGLCADHLLTLHLINNEPFAVGEEAVAWYDLNGISNQRHLEMLRSNLRICHLFNFSIFRYSLLNWRYVLKQVIKSMLPVSCIDRLKKTVRN